MCYKNLLFCMLMCSSFHAYDYLSNEMKLNEVLLAISHNGSQSKYYGWRYYQQLGDVRAQWKAGSRGDKINVHWYFPEPIRQQVAHQVSHYKVSWLFDTFNRVVDFVYRLFNTSNMNPLPYLGLCHEYYYGDNNCFLSSCFLKNGQISAVESYLREWAQLLAENKNDVIVLIFDDYSQYTSEITKTKKYSPGEVVKVFDALIERSGLAGFAYKLKDVYTFPTIGQMRNTNKRALLITTDVYNASYSQYLNKAYYYATAWNFDWSEHLKTGFCQLQQELENAQYYVIDIGPSASILAHSKKARLLSMIKKCGIKSKIGEFIIDATDYTSVNSKDNILTRIAQCQNTMQKVNARRSKENKVLVNIVKCDFIEVGQVYDAVKEVNMRRMNYKESPTQ